MLSAPEGVQKVTAAQDQARNIFFNLALIHPPPPYPVLLHTPNPFGAQDLKQNRQGPAPWRCKVPLERLSAKSPVLPPVTHVAPAAGEVRPLLIALSGAPSSRLPVGDRQGSLPDQAAAAIYRGSQEAAEQEATRLRELRAPPPTPARSVSRAETQTRPYPYGI